jgi:hypothetical protein
MPVAPICVGNLSPPAHMLIVRRRERANHSMTTVCLVACTSKKASYPTIAKNLYRSPLFEGAKWYAETRCESWFILSAKYGLLIPSESVEPYNESLHQMDEAARSAWAKKVYVRLNSLIDPSAKIVFLAGDKYRKHLQEYFSADSKSATAPLSELGIGRQVAWLQKVIHEDARLKDVDRFYGLVERMAKSADLGWRKLGDCEGRAVPKQGIYFFRQTDEFRMSQSFEKRIVRIGTHAVSAGSRATLWNRLRTHRGGANGSGNHRGSIFRLHVGQALIRKTNRESEFPAWGIGQSAKEAVKANEVEIELEVSKLIADMHVISLRVSGEASPDSDRAYIERNLIALLSGTTGPIDLPSGHWLGRFSSRDAIRCSGLWNVNHVFDDYDPNVLNVLERYVESAEEKSRPVTEPLAPIGWRTRISKTRFMRHQFELL